MLKTLILDTDQRRARMTADQLGLGMEEAFVARSPAQARLMLITGFYDRLALRRGELNGASLSLIGVARAVNPDCEILDLISMKHRPASGAAPQDAVSSGAMSG